MRPRLTGGHDSGAERRPLASPAGSDHPNRELPGGASVDSEDTLRPRRIAAGKRPLDLSPRALSCGKRRRSAQCDGPPSVDAGGSAQPAASSSAGAASDMAPRAPVHSFDDPDGDCISEDSDVADAVTVGRTERLGVDGSSVRGASRSRSPVGEDIPPQPIARLGRRRVSQHADPVDTADAFGHTLVITGPIVWCARCGRYAARRVGRALKSRCTGSAAGAYAHRLARLRQSKHPITGADLAL